MYQNLKRHIRKYVELNESEIPILNKHIKQNYKRQKNTDKRLKEHADAVKFSN